MMTQRPLHLLFVLSVGLLLSLSLVGCMPQDPIPVYITPTSATSGITPTIPAPSATTVPTLAVVLPSATPSLSADSRTDEVAVAATQQVTLTPLLPSVTPTTTLEPVFLGPVVGADYTLEPSNTPVPSATPTPSVTPLITAPPRPTDAPSPTPVPVLDAERMGLQVYTNLGRPEWDFFLSRAKETGVSWLKVQANWSFLQPDGLNPSEPNFQLFEQNLMAADNQGFKILLSIAKAPPWARPNSGADAPPEDPQQLAAFIDMLYTQTKLGPALDAIEIWNEPNLRREWNTDLLPFDGAGYMQLFRPAYDAIRRHSPNTIIVTAGLAPTTSIGNISVDDRDYLQQMYNAGLAAYSDVVVGAHPYGWGNAPDETCCDLEDNRGWDDNPHFFFMDNLNATRQIMDANGHAVPIWVTEFGWTSWEDIDRPLPDPEENNLWIGYNTLDDQLNYTVRAFEIGQQRGDVGVMFLWNLNFANDLSVANRDETVGYSLLIPDPNGVYQRENTESLRPRPLFYVLPFLTGILP